MYGNGGKSAQYQSSAVETAGPAQLVLMLYDGALAAMTRANLAILGSASDRTETINRELLRAQDIVSELLVTLDPKQGGQIAANLASLYRFCLELLLDANVRKDGSGIADVASILTQLRDTWQEACCQPTLAAM